MLAGMPQRRTDTPLFHKASAMVACWCLAWAVIGYLNHRAVTPYNQRAGYRESIQACADDELIAAPNGDLTVRRPGGTTVATCTDAIRAHYRTAENAEQRAVAFATLAWALLPSLLLLLLAAFAPELRRVVARR